LSVLANAPGGGLYTASSEENVYAVLIHVRGNKMKWARENQYLEQTGRLTNALFVTTFGSDVGVFTIGRPAGWQVVELDD
jgi:hypothetical protein